MAEIKDKVVTVESLSALHNHTVESLDALKNYNEETFLKKSDALTTIGITATAAELNYMDGVASNVQTQLNAKSDNEHTHQYLSLSGGTLNGNLSIQKESPTILLKANGANAETRLYKNASTTADYGTMLADYGSNGERDALILCRSSALDEKLSVSVQNSSGGNDRYYIYGEHNKPLPSEIGAFSSSGGTVDGDVNVSGIIKVRGQQAFHYATDTNAQTIGTNNATGGTIICCGSDAYLTVNGARLLTAAIVPRDNGVSPNIGYADGRYNCIYLKTAANVSSDERLKRDITNLDNQSLSDFIDKLNIVSYNYQDDADDVGARIGLTAQNVIQADEDIAKFFVEQDDKGYYSLRPSDLIFPLIAKVQNLTKEVNDLKTKLG